MLDKVRSELGPLERKTIAMLGLSFKPNTGDLRDSPAMAIATGLLEEGCRVRVYDPAALEEAIQAVPGLTACRDPYHAAEEADALILATEWNEFRSLDLMQIKTVLKQPVFFDFRNVYEPEQVQALGFRYISVGRGRQGGDRDQ